MLTGVLLVLIPLFGLPGVSAMLYVAYLRGKAEEESLDEAIRQTRRTRDEYRRAGLASG